MLFLHRHDRQAIAAARQDHIFQALFGFDFTFISSSYGFVLSIGSLSGIIGWFIAVLIIRGIFGKMKIIGGQIQASGTPPSPEQASQMQALVARLGKMGKTTRLN